MKITSLNQVPLEQVTLPGAAGCAYRVAISARDGAENFALRIFEVAPKGHTLCIAIPTNMKFLCWKAPGASGAMAKLCRSRPAMSCSFRRMNNTNSKIRLTSRLSSFA